MAEITEIAPDLFRVSVFAKAIGLEFNHFLVRDEEPLLYHTGMRQMFPEIREALAKIIDPATLKWISWSHFEVDECGSLNSWLQVAPNATPVCGFVGAVVNLTDFSDRPPLILEPGDVLETGKRRYRYHPTPHLPHGWDAGAMFEETTATLFCSDLLHQVGQVEPITQSDVILERTRQAILDYQAGPLMDYVPYTPNTGRLLGELAAFNPQTLAIMHGSSFSGDGARMLRELDPIFQEVFGEK